MEALIITDMLNDFVHPNGALYFKGGAQIVPAIQKLLRKARKLKHHIIYLQDTHADHDAEFKLFPRHCVVGSWGSRIIDELKPANKDIIIRKRRFSGFFDTSLGNILTIGFGGSRVIPEVAVVGVCTSICVMDTVQGIGNRDVPVTVYRDMTADLTLADHEYALRRMEKLYGAKIK